MCHCQREGDAASRREEGLGGCKTTRGRFPLTRHSVITAPVHPKNEQTQLDRTPRAPPCVVAQMPPLTDCGPFLVTATLQTGSSVTPSVRHGQVGRLVQGHPARQGQTRGQLPDPMPFDLPEKEEQAWLAEGQQGQRPKTRPFNQVGFGHFTQNGHQPCWYPRTTSGLQQGLEGADRGAVTSGDRGQLIGWTEGPPKRWKDGAHVLGRLEVFGVDDGEWWRKGWIRGRAGPEVGERRDKAGQGSPQGPEPRWEVGLVAFFLQPGAGREEEAGRGRTWSEICPQRAGHS